MRAALLLILFSLPAQAQNLACPGADAFSTASAPLCPESGSLLEDRYPLMALTISDDLAGTEGVLRTAAEVFAAQANPLPLIFINSTPEGFAAIKAEAAKRGGWSAAMIERLRLVHAESEDDFGIRDSFRHAWQQDFVKGGFDPRTGRARARFVPTYNQIGNLAEATAGALGACGIASGAPLATPAKQNGYSGGNFDAGPAGSCVLGRSDLKESAWRAYADHICEGREVLPAPSEWVASTHADEIFKMIPLPAGGACDYAFAIASPRRALEILAAHPEEPAFHPGPYGAEGFDRMLARHSGLGAACGSFQEQELRKTRTYTLEPVEWKTPAGLKLVGPLGGSYIRGIPLKCDRLKNAGLAATIAQDPALHEGNAMAQAKLDAFKKDARAYFKRRLPECGEPRFVELPTLYAARLVEEKDGTRRLGTLGESASSVALFPTPTNSVMIGKTILVPDPFNHAMERDTREQLEALGLRVRFVNTIESHALLGNLHCTTQTFRYCRPRPAGNN